MRINGYHNDHDCHEITLNKRFHKGLNVKGLTRHAFDENTGDLI